MSTRRRKAASVPWCVPSTKRSESATSEVPEKDEDNGGKRARARQLKEAYRAKRETWMQQRMVEEERAKILSESKSRGGADLCLENSNEMEERVLERLTGNIASRLREQLREDVERELANAKEEAKTSERESEAKAEHALSRELKNHACPICYETMSDPKRTPMIIFPCGHTFCKQCLEMHMKTNKSSCPYCRGIIKSVAPNQSLKQLIAVYSEKMKEPLPTAKCGKGDCSSRTAASRAVLGGNEGAVNYSSVAKSLKMRLRILKNEQHDADEFEASLERKAATCERTRELLRKEEEEALAAYERAKAALDLVRDHLKRQEQKLDSIDAEREQCKAKRQLISRTVKGIHAELQKVTILAEAKTSY